MSKIEAQFEKWKVDSAKGIFSKELAEKIVRSTEILFQSGEENTIIKSFWFEFLNFTKKPAFLNAIGKENLRTRWAEMVFRILQLTNYNLLDLMEQLVTEHPDLVLFKDMSSTDPVDWSYSQIYRHLREIAALFHTRIPVEPRVALFTENCLEGACVDLACLMYDIYDTPLSPHFKPDVILAIFDELKINIVVSDSEERLMVLEKIREKVKVKFILFSLLPSTSRTRNIPYLVEEGKKISRWDIDVAIAKRIIHTTNFVATTMFTSGSTGTPKGVSFSIYNIVSKRFARAAAVPEAGNEVFLCYLPLYHTFGRFLEMTGSLFWDGTYIFAGNTSAETLLTLFPRMNPTGFISIPLRWQELYECCMEMIEGIDHPDLRLQAVRNVVGQRLHWGLSAAGYLDPAVFRFFNQFGIHLNSGFGMTEATGGITMTPSGKYKDYSVGIPLPGVYTKLSSEGELFLNGHYIGRYYEDAEVGAVIPYPTAGNQEHWLPTGDVFRITPDGFYEIIDRVKDIYKNNRGQTVAPQVIEKKFHQVPGIKSVFLVGDHRPYNVLLIVPDTHDPMYNELHGVNRNEYYHQIVAAANQNVAPYERVINFTILDHDFSRENGELTSKGSFNRKIISQNFNKLIETLYQSNTVILSAEGFTVQIPKWFFRDLGLLETDISYQKNKLVEMNSGRTLTIRKYKGNWFQIGQLKYQIGSPLIDLGIFTRQPKLWTGNPELISFCPVKEGWDVSMGQVSTQVYVKRFMTSGSVPISEMKAIRDHLLSEANRLLFKVFFRPFEEAYKALEELGTVIGSSEPRLANILRNRLEALAYHPEEEIRCLAYRTILLKVPQPEEIQFLPPFIESGLTFLNERSIREIASSNFGKHRLDALKQRLYYYRTHLKWPANLKHRRAFEDVLGLLFNFAVSHLEYYVPVRAELSRWILHKQDPYLSKKAENHFNRLAEIFEKEIDKNTHRSSLSAWKSKVVFEHGISESEKQRILHIFQSTTFLKESIILTFSEKEFDLSNLPKQGIWVLRLLAYKEFKHYRLAINTKVDKHFDLHLVMSENPAYRPQPETFYWLASLAGFPHGPAVAPILGSSRPNLGILTTQYIGGLTAWDKIRELSEIQRASGFVRGNTWKKIFIKSFAVFFKAWHHSGFQIVPGSITPTNVAIPEMDFRESAVILSLAGWSSYKNTLSLIDPMLQDFYCKTASIYPWCRKQLTITWIFDAGIEALGIEEATQFLKRLSYDLHKKNVTCFDQSDLQTILSQYVEISLKKFYLPVALFNAIDHYQDWYRINPLTTSLAKEQTLIELLELYRLQQYHELVRFYFYRHTYFSDALPDIQNAFDRFLTRIQESPEVLAIQLMELSDLQSTLTDPDDKNIFSRMVFPRLQGEPGIDFLKVGNSKKEHLVVRFPIRDKTGKQYVFREPIEPRETGQLYQLFFRENYPKEITNLDHQYVVTDENERIIGGLTWRYLEDENILLDGLVVTSSLQGKGIASGMIELFFTSMAARGVNIVKAHFLVGNYYLKNFFEVDKKWGAMIKKLN